MKNMNIVEKNLALTVRKEHRLMVINKAVNTSIRISSKAVFAATILSFLNFFV